MPSPKTVDVLCVDDNANNLRSLEALLAEAGASVVPAQSGDEALLKLLERDFALILLDVQMPQLDGYATAQLIRMRERSKHIPIIFITAFDRNESNVVRGYSLGAVDFLFKPVVPEVLKSKVSVFLELHRRRLEVQEQAERLRQADRREHERSLAEARTMYERTLLQKEMERERKVTEALNVRAQELSALVADKEHAEQALRESNLRLALLADTANQLLLGSTDTLEPVRVLCRRLGEHLSVESFMLYTVDGPGTLRLALHDGYPPTLAEEYGHIRFGEGISGIAAAEKRRVVIPDAQRDTRTTMCRAAGIHSIACFPLLAHDELHGTLAFGTRAHRECTPEELSLMQAFCDQLAVALERDRLIRELREGDRRKDDFLAMLAHELRNPLAPIRNALEVFKLKGVQDERLQRAMGSAARQVSHITRLVDDLLDVSRITRGKIELRKDDHDLHALIEQALQACEPLIRHKNHALTVAVPHEPIRMHVDGTRVAQVIGNLLHNAAKYTDPGGRLSLHVENGPHKVVLRVTDNGIGLPPHMLPRVFDPFVQVDGSSDRAQGGLGLGLTLVRSLVEMHGGQVRAESAGPGAGSAFTVELPWEAIAAQSQVPTVQPEVVQVPPLDILLVEDNEDIRETLKDLLELHGHRVAEVGDGVRAVQLVLETSPNVALVDIGLPGFDGYRVAELVRAAANGHRTRLVALTGYGSPDDKRRAMDAGFDAHLVKPVSAEDLSKVLQQLV